MELLAFSLGLNYFVFSYLFKVINIMSVLRILHLVGSADNDFYCDLSRLYAKDCIAATANPSRYEFYIAYITPDRQWRFPSSLARPDIMAAKPMSVAEAIEFIASKNIDLVLPQMFCLPGMTQDRALFDLLPSATYGYFGH
jgi:D-alanine-D-alanine ligase